MKNSCMKGKVGERELCAELNRLFGAACRRSQQYCGAAGDADCLGLGAIHVECKRVERLNVDEAMTQAVDDAMRGKVPAVFHRRSRRPWLVTVQLEHLEALAREVVLLADARDRVERERTRRAPLEGQMQIPNLQ